MLSASDLHGWQLYDVLSHCVCGSSFSVEDAMICKHGGLTFLHHNKLCDLTSHRLKEVCHNVAVEPPLLSLNWEAIAPASAIQSGEAHADVQATGFWGRRQGAFFDIRVFTLTHLATSGLSLLRFSGSMKWRKKGSAGLNAISA